MELVEEALSISTRRVESPRWPALCAEVERPRAKDVERPASGTVRRWRRWVMNGQTPGTEIQLETAVTRARHHD